MNCKLCNKPIKNYSLSLHHFKIDDSIEVDLCQNCIDKFFKWQGGISAKLFPTKALKKRFGKPSDK